MTALFADTRPADLGADGSADPWSAFRVGSAREAAALLRSLRDGSVPINLNGPGGSILTCTLWSLDEALKRLSFSTDSRSGALERLVADDEVVAVAYLESVKLQFELRGLVLVHGAAGTALQARWPEHLYRFQRRSAYRVRTLERGSPRARLRHPALPDMDLALRVLDVSIGGCALLVPADVPPLEPGVRVEGVRVELDVDTRFQAALQLQHVTAIPSLGQGLRVGCEWAQIDGAAQRALQRYIDQTQKRRRLLAAG
jgi:c-di-GMP-binding flagellar brake protein YcgR